MNPILKSALALSTLALAAQVSAQVTLYEHSDFGGRAYTTEKAVSDFRGANFNDRASSVVVLRDRWEVCEDAAYNGYCVVLRPGRYASLSEIGLNDRLSSARLISRKTYVAEERYAPLPPQPTSQVYEPYQRRPGEQLYNATVSQARAVVATPEKHCWVEQEQVVTQENHANVPGAAIGAVIGGILGHQVGGGTGKTVATAGGAVAGGLIGSRVGDNQRPVTTTKPVEHCNTQTSSTPDYWDVTYTFRGLEHRVQMTTKPGATITVNSDGEPRA